MMRIAVVVSVVMIISIAIHFGGCDSSELPNPQDQCNSKKPFTGDFIIFENVGDSLVETDSILAYNYVTFRASADYDTYAWTIGDDPRIFTEKEVTLRFTEATEKVNVILLSTKVRDSCFPSDPTEVTVAKSFSIIQWQYAPIIGSYAGHFESTPNLKDTIKITYTENNDGFGEFELGNINKGCMVNPEFPESSVWDIANRGVQAFYFESRGSHYNGCKSPKVWLRLASNDSIISTFSFLDIADPNQQPPYNRVYDVFKGKKIN